MVKVFLPGLMAENMKEIMSKIKNKDMEHFIGLTKENMLASGLMESSMEKELS